MSSSKEVKDFFVHLIEKIVDPLRCGMQLQKEETGFFLKAYLEALTDNVLLVDESVKRTLGKFMATLTPCILAVY